MVATVEHHASATRNGMDACSAPWESVRQGDNTREEMGDGLSVVTL